LHALHSLVNDGVSTSLTDHKISPLDDNDRHKECSMTCILENLALSIRLQNNISDSKAQFSGNVLGVLQCIAFMPRNVINR